MGKEKAENKKQEREQAAAIRNASLSSKTHEKTTIVVVNGQEMLELKKNDQTFEILNQMKIQQEMQ